MSTITKQLEFKSDKKMCVLLCAVARMAKPTKMQEKFATRQQLWTGYLTYTIGIGLITPYRDSITPADPPRTFNR